MSAEPRTKYGKWKEGQKQPILQGQRHSACMRLRFNQTDIPSPHHWVLVRVFGENTKRRLTPGLYQVILSETFIPEPDSVCDR